MFRGPRGVTGPSRCSSEPAEVVTKHFVTSTLGSRVCMLYVTPEVRHGHFPLSSMSVWHYSTVTSFVLSAWRQTHQLSANDPKCVVKNVKIQPSYNEFQTSSKIFLWALFISLSPSEFFWWQVWICLNIKLWKDQQHRNVHFGISEMCFFFLLPTGDKNTISWPWKYTILCCDLFVAYIVQLSSQSKPPLVR